jgi:hypothetical protein
VPGRPLRVGAEALQPPDPREPVESAVVQIAFSCGSVASLQYLCNGDPSLPKERLEVFCGGAVGVVDDFRSLELVVDGRRRRDRTRRREKGHREEVAAFVRLARGELEAAPVARAAFWSSALTLQVPEALRRTGSVPVALPAALGGAGGGAA